MKNRCSAGAMRRSRVREGYEEWKRTKIYKIPQWLYGPPKGELFKVACEDVPNFGDTSYLEFDAARTAFISIDWQVDFCGEHGYVDVIGYPLDNTANPLKYAARALLEFRSCIAAKDTYLTSAIVPTIRFCAARLWARMPWESARNLRGARARCLFEDR
jgi:hypothetical protein